MLDIIIITLSVVITIPLLFGIVCSLISIRLLRLAHAYYVAAGNHVSDFKTDTYNVLMAEGKDLHRRAARWGSRNPLYRIVYGRMEGPQ